MICNTSLFDIDMFKAVWRPVVSAIAYAFITFDDDYIIERAITGFRQCATLARHFGMPDVFDYVVVQLSQATGLVSEMSTSQVPNYPVVDNDGQPITVSSLSVRFGTNLKGQLAAVVLFNIVNGNGNALREGWTQVSKAQRLREFCTQCVFRSSRCSRLCSCTLSCLHRCCRWRTSWAVFPSYRCAEVNLLVLPLDPMVFCRRCHHTL